MFGRIKQTLFHNLGLKLLALIISLGIWFYASARQRQERRFDVRLRLAPPSGHSIVYQSVPSVRVRLSGPGWLIETLDRDLENRTAVASYALKKEDLREGWADLRVEPGWMQLGMPEWERIQLSFLDITPRTLRAYASPVEERSMPVEPKLGSPPPGLRLAGEPAVSPPRVTARGPAVALDQMESIPTAEQIRLYEREAARTYRDVLPLHSTVEVRLGPVVPEPVPVELELSESTVEVEYRLSPEALERKRLDELPLTLRMPPDFPYRAELEEGSTTVSVALRGSAEDLRRLTAETVWASVNLVSLAGEQIDPGASAPYREAVDIRLPPGSAATVEAVEPESVTVVLQNPGQ
ncbi:MAG: YbbR-like domain-containing protein [Planctomycetota bacterium]